MSGIHILAAGKALPSKVVENADFEKSLDTSDEWIRTRTGILRRHFCDENENAATLAFRASLLALTIAAETIPDIREKIGLVVTATCTPPGAMPSVSCYLQEKLDLGKGIPAFDVNAACSGFEYALVSAVTLMDAMNADYALIVGAEQMSKILDFTDRSTCVLFGDGAGAAVIERKKEEALIADLGAEGDYRALAADPCVRMDGKAVFRFAVTTLEREIRLLCDKAGIALSDIGAIVCHQANIRIIRHVQRKLGLPEEKFVVNLQDLGNTSGASVPMALSDLCASGRLQHGSPVVLVGFGAGLTWGAVMVTI
ncbi:MAG: beta-ketoacyl-ACP synthase III [Lachnospiraceae bacterium]|nr:beta-ketoacyl-ACP synthase III [Lachnospiraceae bacterium]